MQDFLPVETGPGMWQRRRRKRTPTLLTASTLLAVALLPSPAGVAQAVCDLKEQVFWSDHPGTDWRLNAEGSTNDIKYHLRDNNPNCAGTLMWSTSHIIGGGSWGDWMEVGWKFHVSCGITCVPQNSFWFSEWGIDYTRRGGLQAPYPCGGLDVFHSWRASNVSGTTDWKLSVNCGSTWRVLDEANNAGFGRGTPTGETGRRGGESTGMSDIQRDLRWKQLDGDWVGWADPRCVHDNASQLGGRRGFRNPVPSRARAEQLRQQVGVLALRGRQEGGALGRGFVFMGALLLTATSCGGVVGRDSTDPRSTVSQGPRFPANGPEPNWDAPLVNGVEVPSVAAARPELGFRPTESSEWGQPTRILVTKPTSAPERYRNIALIFDHEDLGRFWIIERVAELSQAELESWPAAAYRRKGAREAGHLCSYVRM